MTTIPHATVAAAPGETRPARGNILRRAALLVGILLVVFVIVLPRIVDYTAVAAALATLSFTQLAILIATTAVAFAANGGPAKVLIRELSWSRAIGADIAGRAVVSTIPGPTDIATRFVLYRQWGIPPDTATTGIAFSAFFEVLTDLALPTIALVAIVVTGNVTRPNTFLIAAIGVVIFIGAVLLLAAIVRSENVARRLGTVLDRVVHRIWPLFHKQPPSGIVAGVLQLRVESKDTLSRAGVPAFGAALLAKLAWLLVLEVCLWSVGLGPDALPVPVVMTAMAVVAIVAMVPITPGAIGVTEVAYIGILSAVTGPGATDQITAAVMLFRIAQWLAPIPIGWALLLVMRRGHWGDLLSPGDPPTSAAVDQAAVLP
jgi:uncharacterized protein (TIRG00374 family)